MLITTASALTWSTIDKMSILSKVIKSSISTISSILSEIQVHGVVGKEVEQCIKKHDIICTLETIEMMCTQFQGVDTCPAISISVKHVESCIHDFYVFLQRVHKKIKTHNEGYLSRWTHLYLQGDICDINIYMETLMRRFDIMCKCITCVKKN